MYEVRSTLHDSKQESFPGVTTTSQTLLSDGPAFVAPTPAALATHQGEKSCCNARCPLLVLPLLFASLPLPSLPPSLPPSLGGAIHVGDRATPPRAYASVRACVRVMRWFKLIESIHLRDAYDPLRSHLLYNPHSHFHLKHAQRPRGKPPLLTHPLLCASLAPPSRRARLLI